MPAIDAVDYGEIVIQGRTYYSDMAVWRTGRALIPKTHIMDILLLRKLLAKKPESIVVGVGFRGTVKLLPEVREALKQKNIRLFVDTTPNAMELYNAILAQGKRVLGVMHVTL